MIVLQQHQYMKAMQGFVLSLVLIDPQFQCSTLYLSVMGQKKEHKTILKSISQVSIRDTLVI